MADRVALGSSATWSDRLVHGLGGAWRVPARRYRRRRYSGLDPAARSMLEAVGYRRSMFAFMGATHRNPDILIEARLDAASIVVDGGAFIGEWTERIVERYGATVYAFEPAPMHWSLLDERVGDLPSVTCCQVALGRQDGRARLALRGPGSTAMAADGTEATVDVEVRDVVAVLDGLGVERVHLLKLNIEGGEFDVLERLLETGWAARVDDFLIQFHDPYPGARRRRRRIRRMLERSHAEVWNYPWVWERWQRLDQPREP